MRQRHDAREVDLRPVSSLPELDAERNPLVRHSKHLLNGLLSLRRARNRARSVPTFDHERLDA
jgi:hypothetical protein